MTEYYYDDAFIASLGDVEFIRKICITYTVTFGRPADRTDPADPDELEIVKIESMQIDSYGEPESYLAPLLYALAEDEDFRESLIEHARSGGDDRDELRADYLYDLHRDRSLEA